MLDPQKAKEKIEASTRDTVGTEEFPAEGIPNQKTAASMMPSVKKTEPVVVTQPVS